MKNIFKIFRRDVKKIFTNSVAIILAVGIAVLPSLYAWFNIFANWDPYGSTGNMMVAVVIEDEGFKYRDIEINVGAQIEDNLKANNAIDWQFVTKDDMVNGIHSGKYYAGIEIPSGFSESLTSIVTSNFAQPQITYYANEKKNAIATKITDKVVQTVQQEVNESFVTTVINVVSSLIDIVAEATSAGGDADVINDLKARIDTATTGITNIQKTIDSFENVMKIAKTLEDSVNSSRINDMMENSGELLDSTEDMAKVLQNSMGGITGAADSALAKAASGLDSTADTLSSIGADVTEKGDEAIADALEGMAIYKAELESVKTTLETVRDSLSVDLPALDALIERLDGAIETADGIIDALTKMASGATEAEIKKITSDMKSLAKSITGFRSDYKNDVQPVIDKTLANVIDMLAVTGDLVADLNGQMPTLKALAGGINTTAENGAVLVDNVNTLLGNAKSQLEDLKGKLEDLQESEILNTLQNVTGTNSEQLGAFLACPVIVNTEKVYGIDNYGSAMAPFYSTLAFWVGGMFLIAVMKTEVKNKKEIGNVKMYQAYFGRMLTFLLFSVVQSAIICAGDLYFLKIQCYHPLKYMLAGILAGITYTIFLYSLTYAFGDIGKAIGVIFLVLQIGGSGGTFPIDVVPNFFRVLNPYMPFTFVIEAMRECVCGTYANYYWIWLLKLCAYIVIGLVIGTGVKFLVKKPVRFFEKRVEKTDLF